MFERFTEGAIKIIMLSQEEARKMGHNFVGTEQILLGVLGQKHGIGAKALTHVKVTARRIRREIEAYVGRGTGFVASEIPFTPRAKRVLEMSIQESKDLGQGYVGTEHILLALINESDGIARRTLDKIGVDIDRLRRIIYAYMDEDDEGGGVRPLSKSERFLLERERRGSTTPTLDEFSENISKQAIDGKLDPVVGRETEIDNVIAVLARRTKNNPVLVGEPGVGKTAVAEGLSQLIVQEGNIPDFLDGGILMALDLGSILAGTKYRGEFEERLKRIVEEAQEEPAIVVVIDEIHTLVGAGAAEGAVDAANILKPALARGKFRCIGATTNEEYKRYIERDPALERRFQPVEVPEPDIGVTIQILRGLRSKFEQHHMLGYSDNAIEQAAILSKKYVADRFLPDKAIDVIDEAGARVRLENRRLPQGVKDLMNELQRTLGKKDNAIKVYDFKAARQYLDHELEVRTHLRILKKSLANKQLRYFQRDALDTVLDTDIEKVISRWTGIPVTKLSESESDRLLKLEEELHSRIIGQQIAVSAVARSIRRARVGLRSEDRPIASFIFAGPTGVGKTELTKALADCMFTGQESMIRLDMSEYMEKHTVAKLIGSPPGYVGYSEGGQLTEAVRSKPYSVVLFDEVEKAHSDVYNVLLQILDDGRLTDSTGRVIDFTNTLIVMTTNLGAKVIEQENKVEELGDKATGLTLSVPPSIYRTWEPEANSEKNDEQADKINNLVKKELKQFFRPEFLNRVDEIIIFSHLTKRDLWEISGLMLRDVIERVGTKDLVLEIDDAVRSFLVEEGFDPLYGARPLRRTIMNILEDKLATCYLSEKLPVGTFLTVKRKSLQELKDERRRAIEKGEKLDDIRMHNDPKGYLKRSIDHPYFDHGFRGYEDNEVYTNQIYIIVDKPSEDENVEDTRVKLPWEVEDLEKFQKKSN